MGDPGAPAPECVCVSVCVSVFLCFCEEKNIMNFNGSDEEGYCPSCLLLSLFASNCFASNCTVHCTFLALQRKFLLCLLVSCSPCLFVW